MTDRHIVNKKVNHMLKSAKQEQCSTQDVSWNNFNCAIHPLDSLAKSADKTVSRLENEFLDIECSDANKLYKHRGQSDTQALVQAACRACYKEGSGCPADIVPFLHNEGVTPMPLVPFLGHRFNIFFHNAGGLFYCANLIIYFIEKQADYITCCRALGLVTKYITGPWQRLAEQPNLGILDMNIAFQDGIIRLRKWSVDALPLVSGQAESIFNDVAIKKDVIFDSLTASRANDKRTADVLQNIISDFIPVYERQLHSQLLGGKYNNPSEKLLSEAASCSATNISGERVFVMLDFHTRRTPKAKLDHLEAKIMF